MGPALSETEMLKGFQSKVLLRATVDTPWFVTNDIIISDLKTRDSKYEGESEKLQFKIHTESQQSRLAKGVLTEQTYA